MSGGWRSRARARGQSTLRRPFPCPKCDGIMAVTSGPAMQRGRVTLRRRVCPSCSFQGMTAEFLVDGEEAVTLVESLLDSSIASVVLAQIPERTPSKREMRRVTRTHRACKRIVSDSQAAIGW